jgi:hypothetical protein
MYAFKNRDEDSLFQQRQAEIKMQYEIMFGEKQAKIKIMEELGIKLKFQL